MVFLPGVSLELKRQGSPENTGVEPVEQRRINVVPTRHKRTATPTYYSTPKIKKQYTD